MKNHELGVFHIWVTHATVLVTECLRFSIWVPLVVRLDMSVILVEGIVQIAIDPRQLRNVSEEERSLLVSLWLSVKGLSNWTEHLLIHVGMGDIVSEIPVGLALMPEVLWHGRMIT